MTDLNFGNSLTGLNLEFYDIKINDLNPSVQIPGVTRTIIQKSGESVATVIYNIPNLGTNEFDSIDLKMVLTRTVAGITTTLLDDVLGYNIELESTAPSISDIGN